jgi:hypothetical protein
MDVFVQNIGGALSGAMFGAYEAIGGALRGSVNQVLTLVPAPLAALIAVSIVLALGYKFAK